jgi:hypothetical protein
MADYKLSFTASEINEKLGRVDSLVASVNGVKPDANGNVVVASGGDNGIIDVTELPTENINKGAFYRLMTADFVVNQTSVSTSWKCNCVQTLPEIGSVCTDMTMSFINTYYSIADNEAYGYVDSDLGGNLGIPDGWYPVAQLFGIADYPYNGTITDISDDPCDDTIRILLSCEFYTYKNGWTKTIFAYEQPPKFDITWDGVIGDRFALDLSLLGFNHTHFVKVSDEVFTAEQLMGATYYQSRGYSHTIEQYSIDSSTFSGALDIDSGVIIAYSSDDINATLGLPTGYITNGTYFVYYNDGESEYYTDRLVASPQITKISSKFIDLHDGNGLAAVATSGNYYDLHDRPDIYTDVVRYNTTQNLGTYAKQTARKNIDVYSKSEVDTKIANAGANVDLSGYVKQTDLTVYAKTTDVETMITEAIGSAIGGSY